jgi:hypothetical protein
MTSQLRSAMTGMEMIILSCSTKLEPCFTKVGWDCQMPKLEIMIFELLNKVRTLMQMSVKIRNAQVGNDDFELLDKAGARCIFCKQPNCNSKHCPPETPPPQKPQQ